MVVDVVVDVNGDGDGDETQRWAATPIVHVAVAVNDHVNGHVGTV